MPRVSVVVPVYNTEAHVDECLESIRGQTLDELEILCVDDGSSDNSLARLEAHASMDPRIVILRRTVRDRGPGAARNLAIERATGEYLAFVDSDDRIRPTMLERLTTAASNHGADIAMCMLQTFEDEAEHVTQCTYDREIDDALDDAPFNWTDLGPEAIFKLRFASCNKVYSKSFLDRQKIQYAEGRFYEDMVFTFRALLEAETLTFVREPLYLNRKERTSATTFAQGDRVFDALRSMEELRDILEGRPDSSSLLEAFNAFEFRKLHSYLPKNDVAHITPFYGELRKTARHRSLRNTTLLAKREHEVRKQVSKSNLFEYLIWRVWYLDLQRERQKRTYAELRSSRQELLARVRELRADNRQLTREVRRLTVQQSFRGRWKRRAKRILGQRGVRLARNILSRGRQ